MVAFRDIAPPQVWRELLRDGVRRHYGRGTPLMHQGEPATVVIALTDGIVRLTDISRDGYTHTLALRGPGEILGEIGVLLDRPRTVTVIAATPCVGHAVTAETFRNLLIRYRLETVVYGLTVERLRVSEQLRGDLVRLPPPARLARLLDYLAGEIGQPEPAGVRVELGMPRQELAAMAGMGRSTAISTLARLQSAGILRLGRQRVLVCDPQRLRAAASGP
jgi:CRP-like cAMP-binding protein